MAAPAPQVPRSAPALVSDRNFGPYFLGNLASNIGTWFQQITAAVVIYNLTESTLMVGFVGVSQFLPSLVLAPWTGAAADRFDRRHLLIVFQSIAAVSATTLAVLTATVGLEAFPGAWPVLVASAVIGVVHAISTPAQLALVPGLVPAADLDQAVALNSVTFNLARAVGPALGALVLVTWGPAAAFSVNALSYVALVVGVALVRPRVTGRPQRDSIWSGLRYVRNDRALTFLLIGITALGFGADPMLTLTPALSRKLVDSTFTSADGLVGILISSFGAGAVVATLLVSRVRARWGHIRVASLGLALLTTGIMGLGLAPMAWVAMASLGIAGAGFLLGVTSLTSAIHVRIPDELRGRIMALWGVAFLGSRPVAAFLDGAIADATSPEVATFTAAAIVAVCTWVLVRRLPPSQPAL